MTSRQRAAPAANTWVTWTGSAASSAYRFWIGSSVATTASVTARLSAPYVVEPVGRAAARLEDVEQVGHAGLRRPVRRTASGPVSESVTARATLRRTTSGGSSR